jgi:hypothetical protein
LPIPDWTLVNGGGFSNVLLENEGTKSNPLKYTAPVQSSDATTNEQAVKLGSIFVRSSDFSSENKILLIFKNAS